MEIFKEDFETGTTTMTIQQGNGEVVISSEKPVAGVYSARCKALFTPNVWAHGLLRHDISPNILEVVHEALIRLGQYNPHGVRVLYVGGAKGQLFNFGIYYDNRRVTLMIYGVGTVGLDRYLNIDEVYHLKVYLRCSSASGVADGAVTVWLNNEVIYENNAIDNSAYGLVANVGAGCQSSWGETSTVDYAEVWVDDITADDTLPPPAYYTLSVDSTPITGVSFNLGGVQKITPYSEAVQEGNYTIVIPSEVAIGTDTYRFVRWNDGSTSTTKTVLLNTNISLVVEYELYTLPTHTLTVDSTPIQGIPFTVEKVS